MTAMQDHFIPLRPEELVRQLGDEPSVTIFEREQFRALCELVEATIHNDYRSRLTRLKADYSPFDPDDDSAGREQLADTERKNRCSQLFDDFGSLLTRANYRRLSREQIEQAIQSPSQTGVRLQLNLALFDRLEVYVRGNCELPQHSRSWRRLWKDEAATVPSYRRLAIIFRLRERSPFTDPLDTRWVVLKLFKDIPQEDIETLLPGANVCMGLFEQAKIVVPTISGVGLTVLKLLQGAAAVAFASVYGLIAFLGLVSGAIGYAVRSFFSYLRTREKHQLYLTRNLYYRNLDNNAGVIYHLLAEAEEQEFREIVLAWWLLWRGGLSGASAEQIDAAAEEWLKRRCDIQADFEIGDALEKLERLGLARRNSDHWRAVSMEEALQTLDRAWDEQFAYQSANSASIRPRIWRPAA
jgi:hypothetical protein